MPSVTLTYAELAVRLGRSEDATKSLAKRKRWKRSTGNDGLARITIDEADLADMANPDRRGVGRPPANSTRAKTVEPRSDLDRGPSISVLQTRIAELEAWAGNLRSDVERERGERLQERDRADRLANEVADLARRLADTVEEATARERAIATAKEEAVAIRAELEAIRSRSWWRRLVG
jgi:hypothetical protein